VDISRPAERLEELAQSIQNESRLYQSTYRSLLARAARRTIWRKCLHLSSGTIALISGGTFVSSILGEVAATVGSLLAFLSGIITLITTTFFDEKETEDIIKCATRYDALADSMDSLHERRYEIGVERLAQALDRLRSEENKLSTNYAHLLAHQSSDGPHQPGR
jgi:hypothetical protein